MAPNIFSSGKAAIAERSSPSMPMANFSRRVVGCLKRTFSRNKASKSPSHHTQRNSSDSVIHKKCRSPPSPDTNEPPSSVRGLLISDPRETTLIAKGSDPKTFVEIEHPAESSQIPDRLTFLGLPGEIRNKIYSYVFTPSLERCESTFERTSVGLPLLQSCRQVYHETHSLAYGAHILFLRGPNDRAKNLRRLGNLRPTHLALIKTVAIDSNFPKGLLSIPAPLVLCPTCIIAHLKMPSVGLTQQLRQHVNVLRGILYNLWVKLMLMEVKSLDRLCLVEGGGDLEWVEHVQAEFRRVRDAERRPRKWRLWEPPTPDLEAAAKPAVSASEVAAGQPKQQGPPGSKVQTFVLVRDESEGSPDERTRVPARAAKVEFYPDWEMFRKEYLHFSEVWEKERIGVNRALSQAS